ncbi:MAG: ABC transporter ATP-binding protein, partial [bacterium]|nr:ABC transporter ATP-binding protein [bacterium]
MDNLLEVNHLVKRYGERTAVDDLSFHIAPSEIYGLLGPNGAGKTTTIKIITGLMPPSSGSVRLAGHDPFVNPLAAKAELGWVDQDTAVYEDLTAAENLKLACALARVPSGSVRTRVAELLDSIGLADRAKHRVSTYSGGMKRRLHLALALVHRPKVLLLDEPMVGVDPQARAYLMETIAELAAQGHSVLLTTHDMNDAERLCSRVGIIDGGKLLTEGSVEELQASLGERDVLRLEGTFVAGEQNGLSGQFGAEILTSTDDELLIAVANGSEALPSVLTTVEASGADI